MDKACLPIRMSKQNIIIIKTTIRIIKRKRHSGIFAYITEKFPEPNYINYYGTFNISKTYNPYIFFSILEFFFHHEGNGLPRILQIRSR